MATTISIPNTVAITCCDAIVDACDVGGTGSLVIYDGTPPTNVDTALSSNNILATLALSATAFGAAADAAPNATATANTITANTASGTGTASFFRLINGTPTPVMQGTVGTSGEALNLNSVSIVTGATVDVTSMTVTVPE